MKLHEMITKGNLAKGTSYTGKEIKDVVCNILSKGVESKYVDKDLYNSDDCYNTDILKFFRSRYVDNKYPLGNKNRYFICWRRNHKNITDAPELIVVRDRNYVTENEPEMKEEIIDGNVVYSLKN